jgi:hypothetical protein
MVPVWMLAGPWFNQGVKKEAKQRKQAKSQNLVFNIFS